MKAKILIAVGALVILLLSLMPVPLDLIWVDF